MSDRFAACVEAIDEANCGDTSVLVVDGSACAQALIEGQRAQFWVERLRPDASEPLRLAARAHHIRRWEVPRSSYPRTREGYHNWRSRLYGFHGDVLAALMHAAGYSATDIDRAREILSKSRIKSDPDTQSHEDAVSLAFLEVRLTSFAPTISDEQLLRALRRTWAKMSPAGHEAAKALSLSDEAQAILRAALGA